MLAAAVLASLALPAASLGGGGGGPPPSPFEYLTRHLDLPAPLPEVTRVEHGDFNHDGVPDVAMLRAPEVLIALGPDHYEASYEIVGQAVDLAAFEGGNLHRTDALFVADAAGIFLWRRDLDTGELVSTQLSGTWSTPLAIDSATNSDLYSTLAVLDADTTTIQAQLFTQAEGEVPGQWYGTYPPLQTLGPVHAFRLFQFDGAGGLEVVAVHNGMLGVYSLDTGQLVHFVLGGGSGSLLEVLEADGYGPDQVALVGGAPGSQSLTVFDAVGTQIVSLGAHAVSDIGSGRLYGPTLVDLVLGTPAGALVLPNLAPTQGQPTYSALPDDSTLVEGDASMALTVGDLDHDGDDDLFSVGFTPGGTYRAKLHWGLRVWADGQRPAILGNQVQSGPLAGEITFTFSVSVPFEVAPQAEWIQMLVWSMTALPEPAVTLERDLPFAFTPGQVQPFEVTLTTDPDVFAYIVEMRPVSFDPRLSFPSVVQVYTPDGELFGGGTSKSGGGDDKKGGIVIVVEPPEIPGPNPDL